MAIELREGNMSTQELIEWFGKNVSTYKKTTKKLLEELKYYADYEKFHGGVKIKKIYCKKYLGFDELDLKTLIYVYEAEGNIVSGVDLAKRYIAEIGEGNEQTWAQKFCKSLKYCFGDLDEFDNFSSGIFGWREPVMVKNCRKSKCYISI